MTRYIVKVGGRERPGARARITEELKNAPATFSVTLPEIDLSIDDTSLVEIFRILQDEAAIRIFKSGLIDLVEPRYGESGEEMVVEGRGMLADLAKYINGEASYVNVTPESVVDDLLAGTGLTKGGVDTFQAADFRKDDTDTDFNDASVEKTNLIVSGSGSAAVLKIRATAIADNTGNTYDSIKNCNSYYLGMTLPYSPGAGFTAKVKLVFTKNGSPPSTPIKIRDGTTVGQGTLLWSGDLTNFAITSRTVIEINAVGFQSGGFNVVVEMAGDGSNRYRWHHHDPNFAGAISGTSWYSGDGVTWDAFNPATDATPKAGIWAQKGRFRALITPSPAPLAWDRFLDAVAALNQGTVTWNILDNANNTLIANASIGEDLSGIDEASYPEIKLEGILDLGSSDPENANNSPTVDSYTVSWRANKVSIDFDYDNKLEKMIELANLLGGEVYADANGNLYLKKSGNRGSDKSSSVIFKTGVDVQEAVRSRDFEQKAEYIQVVGSGTGASRVEASVYAESYTRHMKVVNKTLSNVAMAITYGNTVLSERRSGLETVTIPIVDFRATGDYGVGDTAQVIDSKTGLSGNYRIIGIEREYGEEGEVVRLEVGAPRRKIGDEIGDTVKAAWFG